MSPWSLSFIKYKLKLKVVTESTYSEDTVYLNVAYTAQTAVQEFHFHLCCDTKLLTKHFHSLAKQRIQLLGDVVLFVFNLCLSQFDSNVRICLPIDVSWMQISRLWTKDSSEKVPISFHTMVVLIMGNAEQRRQRPTLIT